MDKIKQRDVMEELDFPISWGNILKPTTKLANYKASGLNGAPPNTFKGLNDKNITWLLLSTINSGVSKLTSKNSMNVK